MNKIKSGSYVTAAKALQQDIRINPIAYRDGGASLDGMDCQGLAEYLLNQCGIPYSECNLKGSNAHWRNCVWTGTPEACVEKFGCVPPGAWLFIVVNDGGEVKRGYTDGLGNANHMGVYIGGGVAIHASASRKCVAESVFKEKTIKNGGWNSVGLPPWIDFGFDSNVEVVDDIDNEVADIGDDNPIDQPTYIQTTQIVKIITPDGNPVKMRNEPSRLCSLYWKIPFGMRVVVEKRVHKNGRDWVKVTYNNRTGYVMSEYTMVCD